MRTDVFTRHAGTLPRGVAGLTAILLLSTAQIAHAHGAAGDAVAADAAVAAPGDGDSGEAITVTARNRTENADDVPIPLSVLGAKAIDDQHAYTIADLTDYVPDLTASVPNARRTGVSMRGIGKTSGNDNMEAAVGIIVDDVFLGHVGESFQDFTDLQQVEVLRGPQGTLLGKNTSMGVIKYTSKEPSFIPQVSADIEGGLTVPAFKSRVSVSDGLNDKIAFRSSFFYDRQDGWLFNEDPAVGGRWQEKNRWGTRQQILFEPSKDLKIKLNLDYAYSHERGNTKPAMADPATYADGISRTAGTGLTYTSRLARSYFTALNGGVPYVPIIGSWDTINLAQAQPLTTINYGGSLVVDWKTDSFQITSITAARKFHFSAFNDTAQTNFDINIGGTLTDLTQLSQELRLDGHITSTLDYEAGAYFWHLNIQSTSRTSYGQDAGAFYANSAQYAALTTTQLQGALANTQNYAFQNPITDSEAGFAQINWKPSSRFTLTTGLRVTHEYKSSLAFEEYSYANGAPVVLSTNTSIKGIQTGQLKSYAATNGVPIDHVGLAWLVNPSYHVNDNLLAYASASEGEKSGAVGFSSTGAVQNVVPERTLDFELGAKGNLFDKRLTLSANLFYSRVHNYQANTTIVDPNSSTGFSSVLGNIPGIHARGVEWDSALTLVRGVQATFGGSYNKATYSNWATATCPADLAPSASLPLFCDNTGKQVIGAPLWNLVFGLSFEQPLDQSDYVLHGFVHDTYRTAQNLEGNLSPLGWQSAYHITDLAFGISRKVKSVKYDLSINARNLFNVKYTTSVNNLSSSAAMSYDGIGDPRYIGITFRVQY